MLYSRTIKYYRILALLYFWMGPLQDWQLPTTVFRLCHFLLFPLYPHSSYIQGKDLVILYHKRSKIKIWNKDLNVFHIRSFQGFFWAFVQQSIIKQTKINPAPERVFFNILKTINKQTNCKLFTVFPQIVAAATMLFWIHKSLKISYSFLIKVSLM